MIRVADLYLVMQLMEQCSIMRKDLKVPLEHSRQTKDEEFTLPPKQDWKTILNTPKAANINTSAIKYPGKNGELIMQCVKGRELKSTDIVLTVGSGAKLGNWQQGHLLADAPTEPVSDTFTRDELNKKYTMTDLTARGRRSDVGSGGMIRLAGLFEAYGITGKVAGSKSNEVKKFDADRAFVYFTLQLDNSQAGMEVSLLGNL